MTCDTDSAAAQQAYTDFITTVAPNLSPALFELDKRQVALSDRFKLDPARYAVLDRGVRAEVELFRPENVPIETELSLLSQKFDQLTGAMSVQFDGREQTLPQMARYQESTDRVQREAAWRAVADRRLRDTDAINAIYDDMIKQRHLIARNSGFDNFVGRAFKAMHRFDYTPRECFEFHRGVEEVVVPFVRRVDERRRKTLGLASLRPWDLAVDVHGRGPLRPFQGGRELMSKSVQTFQRLDPRLARMLSSLGDGSNANGGRGGQCLDLDSRKGKAPGGYQYMRDLSRKPFIFMNAAGLSRDVSTMLHEAGHAFHSMVCQDEPLLAYRASPIEFAEVASMTMELLTIPHIGGKDGFYESDDDYARAKRQQLEGAITILPWIATIDAFQHWIYSNPTHTRDQRTAHWLALDARFGKSAVDWSGLDAMRRTTWQRQGHLFGHAFYYIEYGIAQLGALGLWLTSLQHGGQVAVDRYLAGLRLGGSKPLPELFRACGLPFDFGPAAIRSIVDRVEAELDKLPE
jgi:oligoendopeptidase F